MALLNLGEDPWLHEQESCEKLHRDIMEQLLFIQREPKSTERYSQVSASIRLHLKQFNNEVKQLQQKLNIAAKLQSLNEETERRSRQIELLQSKGVHMQKMFDDQISHINRNRSQLMGEPSWGDDVQMLGEDAPQYTIDQLRSHQSQMLQDQDRGLENLLKVVARQKNIAETINSEVDLQNDIIDDLGDHIDRTDTRVAHETRNIRTIDRKDKTCIYWVIIILLFISIITVVAV